MKARRLGSGLRRACPENFSRQCMPAMVPDAMSHGFPFNKSTCSCFPFFYYIVQQRMKTSTYSPSPLIYSFIMISMSVQGIIREEK